MAVTPQDSQIAAQTETAFGVVGGAGWRFYEFLNETLDFNKNVKQSPGLRSGVRVARSARRYVPTAEGAGDLVVELQDKALGQFLQAAFGQASSTGLTGGGFQQMFTLGSGASGSVPFRPSMTVQKGIANPTSGNVEVVTYLGSTVDQFMFTFPQADIATLKMTLNSRDVNTSAASAGAPSYVATPSLFHFGQANFQVCLASSLTVPVSTTPTAVTGLAAFTGPGPIANVNVRSAEVSVDNKAAQDRYNMDGTGRKKQPVAGIWDLKGKFTAEYSTTAFRDAYLADSPLALVITYVSTTVVGSTFTTLQVVIPEVKLDSSVPQVNGYDLITTDFNFTILDNLSAQAPIYVVMFTSDTSL